MTSQQRFFEMLNQVPRIKHLWDQDTREINVEAFERELRVMSSGEIHIAKFFAAVWFNDNTRYGFDIVDAAARLDKKSLNLIRDWLADPFWP